MVSNFTAFKKAHEDMIAKNSSLTGEYSHRLIKGLKQYDLDEVVNILNGASLTAQQRLSQTYYNQDGFYKRIILYYATLLNYNGLLIPNPSFGKQLSDLHIKKRYYAALNYTESLNLKDMFTHFTMETLINGSYYGIIQIKDKEQLIVLDLPYEYSRSRFKDKYGHSIVEFNVNYFDTILEESVRAAILKTYPKIIANHYRNYQNGKVLTSWLRLPSEMSVYFDFCDNQRPLFLDIIPAMIEYDQAVDTEHERSLEEIRKIIVQKIPHLNDGALVFEPNEALEMHNGAVGMMKGNKNLSVLTTYADVDAITSKTSNDNSSRVLENMLQNTYASAGVSGQLFAADNSQSVKLSILNDITLMMVLGRKFSIFLTSIVNELFSNSNINFKYEIYPVSDYNRTDYITDSFKLAQSGYSFLVPNMALGLSQRDLVNLKDLENNVLNLKDTLIPLSSSYTQSSDETKTNEKPLEDKSEKTIQNEESIDNQ